METYNTTREHWLQSAISSLRPTIVEIGGLTLPPTIHVSVGFPSTRALSARRQRIGECWHAEASTDGMPHVLISPLIPDGLRVLDILIHELIHAAGISGHRGDFKRPAVKLGLTGKMTATTAGPELIEHLKELIVRLGPYPHSAISPGSRTEKKQPTYLLKAECECGAIIRVTRKVVDNPGLPICACGGEFYLAGAM